MSSRRGAVGFPLGWHLPTKPRVDPTGLITSFGGGLWWMP